MSYFIDVFGLKKREKLLRDELYVMLMLQRSEEGTSKVDCEDAAIAVACALDSDKCPAECKEGAKDEEKDDEVVKAGSLVVSVNENSSEVISVPKTGIITLASIDLDSSESITLDNITVSKIGLSSKADIKSIWFEKDGVRISGKASLASDGTASATFNNGFNVKSSDTIDLVAELNAANAGSELQFEITKVESTAKDYSIKGGKTPTYRTVNYTVAKIDFTRKGNNTEYKLGDQDSYEIAKFDIENNNNTTDDKDIKVESITLKNIGTADLENLDNIVVYRDSKKVSDKVTVNGKNLVVTLNDTIESGRKGMYTIEANVTYVDRSEGDKYQLSLNKTADLVAYETSTNMRVTIQTAAPVELYTYTVKGGKMVFATASDSPKSVDAGAGYTDVVLAEGTLTVAEPIKLDTLELGATVTAGTHTLSEIFKKVRVEIGNSSYTAEIDDAGTLTFDNEMYISKTSKVKVIADISANAADGDKVTIDPIKGGAFKANGGEYQNSSNTFDPQTDMAGSITIAKLTVKAAKFNMTKTSKSSEIKVVKTVNEEVSIFNGKITNNQNSALTVNDLTLSLKDTNATAWTTEEIYFTLKIGSKTISKTYKRSANPEEVVFSSLGVNLDKDESVEFEILASATTLATSPDSAITINAKATGTDANGNESKTNEIFVANYKLVDGGSVNTAKSAITDSAFTQNTDSNVFAQWTVTVKNEDLTLKSIEITADGDVIDNNTLNTWKVTYGSNELNGSISKTAGGLLMDDLNETLKPGTYTFKAVADFGSVADGSAIEDLNVTAIDMVIEGVQGPVPVATVSPNYAHAVIKAVPVISFVKTRDSDNDVKKFFAIKISNPSSSEESITLGTFDFDAELKGAAVTEEITYGEDRAVYANDGSDTVVLAPGESETFYFEAETAMENGSFSAVLNNVTYTVDGADVTILNLFNNVVKWADLKVSGRIAQ